MMPGLMERLSQGFSYLMLLATLCAIQTFDFMENPSRYGDFARECTYYVLMSIYLVRSKRMRAHFGEIKVVPPGQPALTS